MVNSANKSFELIEHTADIGAVIYGHTLPELFSNAAKALYNIMLSNVDIGEHEAVEVETTAESIESLPVAFLNELIFLFDTSGIIINRFDIRELSDTKIKATGFGEKFERGRHVINMPVKAATYHMVKLERNDGYRFKVIFDI